MSELRGGGHSNYPSNNDIPDVGDIIIYNEVIKNFERGRCPLPVRAAGKVIGKTESCCIVERTVSEDVRYKESILVSDLRNGLFVFLKLKRNVYISNYSYAELSLNSLNPKIQECVL